MKKLLGMIIILIPAVLFGASANVAVDYGDDNHFYERDMAFGTNFLGEWTPYKLYQDNIYRFQQAGTRFVRFPGGSNSNEYHWNGNGYYDANKVWNVTGSPNVTTFQRGFYNLSNHRGSLSKGYGKKAMITDGDLNTYWLSYPDAEGLQWVYIDIQTTTYNPVPVNRIVIDWGTPYATLYKIQYSNGNWNGVGQWGYNDTAWTDTNQNNVVGTGGQADLSFTAPNAKYIRVLCQTSSGPANQFSIKEIKLYNGLAQITNNVNSVLQSPSVSSSVGLGDSFQEFDTMDFEQFMSVVKSMTPPAEPLITINFFTGTTQEAADWVYYANVEKLYGIKYWEIGNENWGNWESGGPCDPVNYAKRFLALYDAMTAVDPDIVIAPQFNTINDLANVTMTAGYNAGASDYYIDTFLKYLADHGRADILKGVSVHRYPTWQPASEAVPLAQVDLWSADIPRLKTWINNRCTNPADVKIWLTEYNDGIDSAFTNHFSNSLFVTAFVLNYLRNGGDYTAFFRPFGTPGPGQADLTIFSDFGYLEGGGLGGSLADFKYQPRSSFYAFEMLYNRFSADDSFGNTLVGASSDNSSLKVYANKRGDRKLSIAFVNIDAANTINASIALTNFTPLASGELVKYTRQNYSWILNGSNSYASPDNPPAITVYNGAAQNFTFAAEPYSVSIITLYDSTQATLVPSNTPTMLPTATITPTPVPNGGSMLDDCEDGDLYDIWGGVWSTYGDLVSSYPRVISGMTCGGGGAPGSDCYMKLTGTVVAGSWGYGINIPLNPSWAATDVSMYDGVFFWYKGDGATARLAFPQPDYTYGNFGIDFTVNTYWAYYQIPFSALTGTIWNTPTPGIVWTAQNIQAAQIQPASGGAGPTYREINIDNIGFYKNTPTVTPTQAPVSADIKSVKAYPQPCNMKDKACKGITFVNLTAHTDIRIYTLKGELVFRKDIDTPAGEYYWDIAGIRKSEAIASGVYLYTIINEKKDVARGRVAIIR
jgi:hypothetical protein